jgi:hypothetical protein
MSNDVTGSDRWIIVVAALLFWLLVPFPFWLLGLGFAGAFVLPGFQSDGLLLLDIVYAAAFYGPLLLIGLVVIDAFRSRPRRSNNARNDA